MQPATATRSPRRRAAGTAAVLAQLPKATFRAHIAERLRQAILSGALPPGTPLVETALATQFAVSRAPGFGRKRHMSTGILT